jgi:hypothetical protein
MFAHFFEGDDNPLGRNLAALGAALLKPVGELRIRIHAMSTITFHGNRKSEAMGWLATAPAMWT